MKEFSALQLKAHLDQYEQDGEQLPLLLDVRQPWEFDICKIEGSELVPMSTIPEKLKTLDLDRETVVICHHGIRSRQVGRYMEQNGFSNVINLSGGVAQWAQTVDDKMATY